MVKAVDGVLKAVKKVRGGVKVDHHKNTAESEVVRLPIPSKVVIPMQQHIGAPCEPVVKVGDEVAVGQVIGDTDKFVSAPIHASVSGKVIAVGDVKLPNGVMSKAVTIESDGEMRLWEGIEPPKVETKEDFIKAVRASGLVGLGGAGFPTHIKFNPRNPEEVDTLIVNGAECEPYITVDHQNMVVNAQDIMDGMLHTIHFLNLKKGIMPIYEPGLSEMVLQNAEAGRLRFSTSLVECLDDADVVFSAVGTPPDEDGSADLRYVLEVAQHGNFSLAAEACHVGQPALSQQIAKLEKELGVPLFHRNSRGAILTEAGKEFTRRALQILQQLGLQRIEDPAIRKI